MIKQNDNILDWGVYFVGFDSIVKTLLVIGGIIALIGILFVLWAR